MYTTPHGHDRPIRLSPTEIANDWAAWGWREDQHHCILIAFFESWRGRPRPNYAALAKVLEDHYRQAVFPGDMFVYWLAGAVRHEEVSYVASREEFDERYLAQFGPLFDAVEWLKAYRADPQGAIRSITPQQMAADKNVTASAEPGEIGRGRAQNRVANGHSNEQSSNSAERIVRRLKRDHPQIAAALAAGAYPSARAAGIAAGFIRPPSPLETASKAVAKLNDDEWEQLRHDEVARRKALTMFD